LDDLETLVRRRTAELEAANASLKKEIAERNKFEGVVQAILK
jgi:C4-dicarboxylate-specific signal transduction histidine kinase